MRLKSITYSQFEGTPDEWSINDFSLRNINLIVGKNASGKTRTLNIIQGLGNLVSGDTKLQYKSGNYKATFDKEGEIITYILKYEESKVVLEKMIVGSKDKLNRGLDGKGTIWSDEDQKEMKFQAPDSELACVNRRDSIQHPFFEDLYQWGKGLRHYSFGEKMGRDVFVPVKEESEEPQINLKDTKSVIKVFSKGEREYGKEFKNNIINDMVKLGYKIDDINIGIPKGLIFSQSTIYAPLQGFILKESDLPSITEQNNISSGMFRALSLIIQLNYSQLASIPSCILIDDIGEGLDYDRSMSLIKLVIEKAKNSSIQLIMSTNDRFVMNNVPLEYWVIILRSSNKPNIYNYENAKNRFDEFALTGLSNFDFFSTGLFEESLMDK